MLSLFVGIGLTILLLPFDVIPRASEYVGFFVLVALGLGCCLGVPTSLTDLFFLRKKFSPEAIPLAVSLRGWGWQGGYALGALGVVVITPAFSSAPLSALSWRFE